MPANPIVVEVLFGELAQEQFRVAVVIEGRKAQQFDQARKRARVLATFEFFRGVTTSFAFAAGQSSEQIDDGFS